MFKVGDKVKYSFSSGRSIYGTIISIESESTNCYTVLYYDEDTRDCFVYEENENSIELVEEGTSVDDNTKFRAFLEEVASIDSSNYVKEYHMLERIIRRDFANSDERRVAIKELCNFYKDFTPSKRMTVSEIEKELGYKIEVVE